ncbi:30S ribosomal protein S24e [Candidatus Bathyarchaeota archaeon CG07_land_8_20_14_0_80_47_9]|jgi:small subunit ribosomal protein S24e|nr:MAG: 30S ribosomal protein S24e [Candidatus Bathyarchaeota archaeon CG07_land_8_20_14_0_80_47_9]
MEVKVISETKNPLLRRTEVQFELEHAQAGSTPPRLEVRKAVATALKADANLVFLKRFATKTGTHSASGIAHVYDSVEQAKLIEPEYIVKRNIPPEKPKEEVKEQK